MSKHILIIIDGLPGGGAEKVAITLALGFLASGNNVSLFSLRNVCDYSIPDKVNFQVISDNYRWPKCWFKLTELTRRAKQLDDAVLAACQQWGEFDLIISNLHKTDRIVRRSRHLAADKVWFCLHSVFSAAYLSSRTGLMRWLKKIKIRQVYQYRNIVAVSHHVLEDLKQTFNITLQREQVIANPFDIDAIRKASLQPCEMAGQDYLLSVGRIHPTKRHDRLLKAYAKSGLSLPLVIIGICPAKEKVKLKRLAAALGVSERIIFKDFTLNPYSWIKNARMLIVSSDSEGFGNVLIEALICQTPVVSTRCPGGPEAILQGELMRGLSEMNAAALADKIVEIYNQPPDMCRVDIAPYRVESICQRYLNLIEPSEN